MTSSRSIRRVLTTTAALASALAACDSPTVPPRAGAYEFAFDGPSERLIYRWPDGETIGVYVVESDDAERNAVLRAAFRHAAAAWNPAVLYGQYRFVAAPLESADVVIAWNNEPLPLDISECPPFPTGFAWTTFCADENFERITAYPLAEGEHREDGVHMIVQVVDDAQTEGHVTDLVTHELGHVLGIGRHPCRPEQVPPCSARRTAEASIMYSGMPDRSLPTTEDRVTVELLYHTVPHLTP